MHEENKKNELINKLLDTIMTLYNEYVNNIIANKNKFSLQVKLKISMKEQKKKN